MTLVVLSQARTSGIARPELTALRHGGASGGSVGLVEGRNCSPTPRPFEAGSFKNAVIAFRTASHFVVFMSEIRSVIEGERSSMMYMSRGICSPLRVSWAQAASSSEPLPMSPLGAPSTDKPRLASVLPEGDDEAPHRLRPRSVGAIAIGEEPGVIAAAAA